MRVRSEQLYHLALPNESYSRSQCAEFEADCGLELATVSKVLRLGKRQSDFGHYQMWLQIERAEKGSIHE
jgi:hypothetical protein